MKNLNENKASEKSNIPITIIHEIADIFADLLATRVLATKNTPKAVNDFKNQQKSV